MRCLASLAFVVVLTTLWAGRAFAEAPASVGTGETATPEALLAEAAEAERAANPKRAVVLYRRAVEIAGTSRLVRRARARLRYLEARSEGDYAPLAALMRVQRETLTAERARAFEAEARRFPPGRVRREALNLLGDAYLKKLDDPEAALRLYEAWAAQAGISEGERQLAESGVALARAALGGLDASVDHLHERGLGGRAEATFLRASQVGRVGRVVSLAAIAAFLALALALGGWRGLSGTALRASLEARRLALGAWVLAVPTAMIILYDTDLVPQFAMLFGTAAVAVAVSAILGGGMRQSGVSGSKLRGMAFLGAVATLAALFVALDLSRLLFDIMLGMDQAWR